jgi:hypothetical protein
MEQEPNIQSATQADVPASDIFWPVLLMGLSLVLVLSWEIWIGAETRRSAQQLQEQQVKVVDQAKQVQLSLEKLVRGWSTLPGLMRTRRSSSPSLASS